MTDQDLLWFKCSRNGCNKLFMSYVYGKYRYLPNGDMIFYDNTIGEILVYTNSNNSLAKGSYVYPIDSNHNKLCRACRKGNDLLEY